MLHYIEGCLLASLPSFIVSTTEAITFMGVGFIALLD